MDSKAGLTKEVERVYLQIDDNCEYTDWMGTSRKGVSGVQTVFDVLTFAHLPHIFQIIKQILILHKDNVRKSFFIILLFKGEIKPNKPT